MQQWNFRTNTSHIQSKNTDSKRKHTVMNVKSGVTQQPTETNSLKVTKFGHWTLQFIKLFLKVEKSTNGTHRFFEVEKSVNGGEAL